jgi:hypothetical protein
MNVLCNIKAVNLIRHLLWGAICFSMVLVAMESKSQPTPIRFAPFEQVEDSARNPTVIMDAIFLPKANWKKASGGWALKNAEPFRPVSKDYEFYLMTGLLLFVGLTIRAFPNYFANMSRLLFQSGFRQKSIRDQLVQNTAASLAVNAIYFVAAGIYIYLIGVQRGFAFSGAWYTQILACISFLLFIYLVKNIALTIGGWVFSTRDMLSQYAFIIFFVNKIIGLLLLPILIVLLLGRENLHPIFTILSFIALFLLFLYRYFLILPAIRRQSGVSSFHFFIYLCTFEILPILILVKFLVNLLTKSN